MIHVNQQVGRMSTFSLRLSQLRSNIVNKKENLYSQMSHEELVPPILLTLLNMIKVHLIWLYL
jgi:hypothetical protein